VELIIAKNRNGSTGHVDLFFYHNWLRFEDMLDPER
jgi:replicative DNA helicase